MAHKWIKMTPDSPIPRFAVVGEPDRDGDGFSTYVGRACHEGGTFPARIDSKNRCAYISWGGSQIKKMNFEVLVGENYRFVKNNYNGIPFCSVRAGNTAEGEPLWVGRGVIEGNVKVGQIHPIHECLFVAFRGEEYRTNSYEVLIRITFDSSKFEKNSKSTDSSDTKISKLDNTMPEEVVKAKDSEEDKDTKIDTGTDMDDKLSVVNLPLSPTWQKLDWCDIYKKGVYAGMDKDGALIFVGRSQHEGEILPAKVIPVRSEAYVTSNKIEVSKYEFEILVGDGYSWVQGMHSGDKIPSGAVCTGKTSDGKEVYVGRGIFKNALTPGKVYPGMYSVFIPFNFEEREISNYYEILVKTLDNNSLNSVDKEPQSSIWVNSKLDNIPSNAVITGLDEDQSPIYVGRGYFNDQNLPANVNPAKGKISVSFDTLEINIDTFDVLVGDGYSWVRGKESGDNIPPGAVCTGQSLDGTQVYVGRAQYEGLLILGRVYRQNYGVYIPFKGKEHKITNYEILVKRKLDNDSPIVEVYNDLEEIKDIETDVNKNFEESEGTEIEVPKNTEDREDTAIDMNKDSEESDGTQTVVDKDPKESEKTEIDVDKDLEGSKLDNDLPNVEVNNNLEEVENRENDVNKNSGENEDIEIDLAKKTKDREDTEINVDKDLEDSKPDNDPPNVDLDKNLADREADMNRNSKESNNTDIEVVKNTEDSEKTEIDADKDSQENEDTQIAVNNNLVDSELDNDPPNVDMDIHLKKIDYTETVVNKNSEESEDPEIVVAKNTEDKEDTEIVVDKDLEDSKLDSNLPNVDVDNDLETVRGEETDVNKNSKVSKDKEDRDIDNEKPTQTPTSVNSKLDNALPHAVSLIEPSESHTWISSKLDTFPPNAVVGGVDTDFTPLYVGRALQNGENLPAKVRHTKFCYISIGGVEIVKDEFEILVGDGYSWVVGKNSGDNIPIGAVSTGKTADGKEIYVGRGIYKNSLHPGKVHPGICSVYIPFSGREHKISDYYEILVRKSDNVSPNAIDKEPHSSIWLSSELDKLPENAVVAGVDKDKSLIYVSRSQHNDVKLPAKVIPKRKQIIVSFDELEVFKDEFEVLTGDGYSWVAGANSGDNIPTGAVSTGQTLDGRQVYVGRALYEGTLTPGKVLPGIYCVYIPFAGKEHKITTYEILVKS